MSGLLKKSLRLPFAVFLFVLFLLIPVQLKVENPMLLLERFIPGAGWFEIILIAL
ncbi:MAG: 4Fe-4S binding protein, partial [Bacteroidetes bacterium]|nr:4Fe-4S binding protein [Bacteroidota bacterium]